MKNVHVGWAPVGLTDIGNQSQPKLILNVTRINGEINHEYSINIVSSVDGEPTWTSSNTSVATVENGVVKVVGYGQATITVEVGGIKGTCTVVVKEPVISVTGVTLDRDEITMKIGEVVTLIATVTPDDAANKNVTWSSTKSTVASVSNGKVTAKSEGEAIIKVTTKDGGYIASCKVIVEKEEQPEQPEGKLDTSKIYYGVITQGDYEGQVTEGLHQITEDLILKAIDSKTINSVDLAPEQLLTISKKQNDIMVVLLSQYEAFIKNPLGEDLYPFEDAHGLEVIPGFKLFGELVLNTAEELVYVK